MKTVLATLLGLTLAVAVRATVQGPPAPPPGGQTPTVQGGRGGAGQRGRGFPAQQRPLADPAVIARGKTLYEINCRACHGADLRGGDIGGPNLLRSSVALNDVDGEAIGEVVRTGRMGMDPFDLPADDTKAIAAYVRSVLATARGQGAPPAGSSPVTLNVLVGDAKAGQTYFAARCSSCHSPAGDLSGIAERFPDPMTLQNLWVSGGGGDGRGGRGRGAAPAAESSRSDVIVTVTLPSGQKVEGPLERIDDFIVVLTRADGTLQSFRRDGDVPKIDIRDPLETHKKLLLVYTNTDIHNVTAYLATLK